MEDQSQTLVSPRAQFCSHSPHSITGPTAPHPDNLSLCLYSVLKTSGFVLLQLFPKCLRVPLHCVRNLDLSLHSSSNLLAINARHVQSHGVLDLRDRGKRDGKKALCSKCVFMSVMDRPVRCVQPLFLLFNVSCSRGGRSTPNSGEDAAKSFLKDPDICCCKADGICKQPVLNQLSVSRHQESEPQARTWKGGQWAGKELPSTFLLT